MVTELSVETPPAGKQDDGAVIQLPPGGVSLVAVERELVRQAMERAGGNQTRAAQLLGLERDALRRRLIKFGFLSQSHPATGKN